MTDEIIRRPAGQIGPSDSTKDLIVEKNVNQLDSYQRSGLNTLNQTIKKLSSAPIPNTVEGVVIGYINNSSKVQYKLVADNARTSNKDGRIEGYCVIVRTSLDIGTKTDPEKLLKALSETKTEQEKTELRFKITNAILEHDVVAAASEEERLPKLGEHVDVDYYNSLVDSGEPIKGFYRAKIKDNSYYEEPKDLQDFYNTPIDSSVSTQSIIPQTDGVVPTIVDYANAAIESIQGFFGTTEITGAQRSSEVTPLNQGDRSWGSLSLGNSNIAAIGCCLTSYTMAHNYLLNPTNELTPDVSREIGLKAGGLDYRGYVVHATLAKALNMFVVDDIKTNNTGQLRSFIESGLNSSDALLFHVDWKNTPEGDHWIMCYKKDQNGNYFCNDPAGGKNIVLDKETLTSKSEKQYKLRKIIRLTRQI